MNTQNVLTIDPSVRLRGLAPQVVLAIFVAWSVYQAFGVIGMRVTSCTEGKHSRASLHYTGNAVDLRIWNIPAENRAPLVAALKAALGAEFDAVLESNHIHVEYQPKEGA